MRRLCATLCLGGVLAILAPAHAAELRAGAGRADITPPTGFYKFGYVSSDAKISGQHTRLFARALVLERDGTKVALVGIDLGAAPGGLVKHVADRIADVGLSERSILVSASHTHSGPSGFFNFRAFNFVPPTGNNLPYSVIDFNPDGTPAPAFRFAVNDATDNQLYSFLVNQIAAAIRRAEQDLGPAKAAWGNTTLSHVTRNRSVEAHLANHGIVKARGEGTAKDDPEGVTHTIDENVEVLRVDKLVTDAAQRKRRPRSKRRKTRGKRSASEARRRKTRRPRRKRRPVVRRYAPIGAFTTFSAHGTIVQPSLPYYDADHHGSATRVFERIARREGNTPAGQEVVNAYGNTDQGDVSAGLDARGPAYADYVGREAADAMLRAWRDAGTRLSPAPELGLRWTRICFCGQETEGGTVDSAPYPGAPFFTGSEENRGPLHELTGQIYEGYRSPVATGPQGAKSRPIGSIDAPKAAPLLAVRVANRMIVSVPGEMTAGMGRRVRESVLAATREGGIDRAVISGLANEFIHYFTTPEEYDQQHYEGGATLYGRVSSNLLKAELTDLSRRLVAGAPAPNPVPYDPTNGVNPTAGGYDRGPATTSTVLEPGRTARLGHATFRWRGGLRGFDRPLDSAFVTVRRKVGDAWRTAADDLGLEITWEVDRGGVYTARWEVPVDAPRGTYSFVVTGNRYRLESSEFEVVPTDRLSAVAAGRRGDRVEVRIAYPDAAFGDFTYRPKRADGGSVNFSVNGREVAVRSQDGLFGVRAAPGDDVVVPAGKAADRFGNTNGNALRAQ